MKITSSYGKIKFFKQETNETFQDLEKKLLDWHRANKDSVEMISVCYAVTKVDDDEPFPMYRPCIRAVYKAKSDASGNDPTNNPGSNDEDSNPSEKPGGDGGSDDSGNTSGSTGGGSIDGDDNDT